MARLFPALALLGLLNLASAHAEDAPACAGRDLTHDADLHPDWAGHADDLLNGDGLLWRVEKPGLAASYLYGTIHSTAAGPIALARQTQPLIEQSKHFVSELGLLDARQKVDMSAALLQAALSPDKDTIAAAFDAEDAAKADAYFTRKGMAPELAHHLALWLLAVFTSLPSCESEGQRRGLPAVDDMLAEIAQARRVPIVALESVGEQLKILADIPSRLSALLILTAAQKPELEEDSYKTLLDLYLDKRPSAALVVLDALPDLTPEAREAEKAFTRLLLNGRNQSMIERAAPLLGEGGAFVAVGALHLVGKDGLVELARRRGYVVTKVW